jgi:hypothetical protein
MLSISNCIYARTYKWGKAEIFKRIRLYWAMKKSRYIDWGTFDARALYSFLENGKG